MLLLLLLERCLKRTHIRQKLKKKKKKYKNATSVRNDLFLGWNSSSNHSTLERNESYHATIPFWQTLPLSIYHAVRTLFSTELSEKQNHLFGIRRCFYLPLKWFEIKFTVFLSFKLIIITNANIRFWKNSSFCKWFSCNYETMD